MEDHSVFEPDYSEGRSSDEELPRSEATAQPEVRPHQYILSTLTGEEVHTLVHDTPIVPELTSEHNQYLTLLARILVADETLLEEAILAFRRKTGLHPAEEVLRDWLLVRADAVVNAHPSKLGGLVYNVVGSKFRQLIGCPTADVSLNCRGAAEQFVLHAARQGRLLALEEQAKAEAEAVLRVEPAPKLAPTAPKGGPTAHPGGPAGATPPGYTASTFVGPKSKGAFFTEEGKLLRPRGYRSRHRASSKDPPATKAPPTVAPSAGGGSSVAAGGISRQAPFPKGVTEAQLRGHLIDVNAFVGEICDYYLVRMSTRHPFTQHQMHALVTAANRLRHDGTEGRVLWFLVDTFPPLREWLKKRGVRPSSHQVRYRYNPVTSEPSWSWSTRRQVVFTGHKPVRTWTLFFRSRLGAAARAAAQPPLGRH